MHITVNDLQNFSPSKHDSDVGQIMMLGFADGINGTKTEIDYSNLFAGNEEQFNKNCAIQGLIHRDFTEKYGEI